jgi:Adenylate and Guanylate cyclase catalytic domain
MLDTMERETDVRHVLPAVHVPTLVLHRTGDQAYLVEEGRYLAEHIAGAMFVELDGVDHLPPWGDADAIVREIDRFLGSVLDEEAEFDRVLATVMFTDIVGSAQRASRMGDRAWRQVLVTHHQRVRGVLTRYRGREVDTAGDGFLATFMDRPEPSDAPWRSPQRWETSVSRSASDFTRVRSSSRVTPSGGSPSTSVPAWRPWHDRAKCSSRVR